LLEQLQLGQMDEQMGQMDLMDFHDVDQVHQKQLLMLQVTKRDLD